LGELEEMGGVNCGVGPGPAPAPAPYASYAAPPANYSIHTSTGAPTDEAGGVDGEALMDHEGVDTR
jgi:hypothetical protein